MRIFKPLLLLSIILLISSCGLTNMANKYDTVKYTISPPILQTHGGEIEVKIDGNFPEKYFAKKATVELTPVLIYNNNQSETAFEKIAAGASAVQLYTGLIYKGPNIVKVIKKDLIKILNNKGFKNISEAVGTSSH